MSQIDGERVIFSGDFNIDVLKCNSTSVKYLDKILSHNLHQIVNCPTRITHKTRSCIDNIITNINKAKSMVCHHQISDHQIVLCLFDKQELNVINSNHTWKIRLETWKECIGLPLLNKSMDFFMAFPNL